jgi:hypothetical protein
MEEGSGRSIEEFIRQNFPEEPKKSRGFLSIFQKDKKPDNALDMTKEDRRIFKLLQENKGDLKFLTSGDISYIVKKESESGLMSVFYREFKTEINAVAQDFIDSVLNGPSSSSSGIKPS